MTPTPEDMARSPEADLEVAESAPGGPWYYEEARNVINGRPGYEHRIHDGEHAIFSWFEPDELEVFEEDPCPLATAEAAMLVVTAREALPAYCRRVMAAEAILRRLAGTRMADEVGLRRVKEEAKAYFGEQP